MRRFAVVFVSTLFPFSLLSLATQSALAADDEAPAAEPAPAAAPAPPPGYPPPGYPPPPPAEAAPEPKQFVIMFNPLGVFIGRYSLEFEYMPVLHHAITLNPAYTHAAVTSTVNGVESDLGSLNGFSGELGYKYYTGKKGPNGFFVGPSFLFGSYSQSYQGQKSDSFTALGYAVDIGGQAVIGSGFVIGGGFGLQWTHNSHDITTTDSLNLASEIIAGGGWRPRFLFTVGYAF